MKNTESLGQILLRDTSLTAEQLDMALRFQQTRRPRPSLGSVLLERGFITELELCVALAHQWDIPYLDTIVNEQIAVEIIKKMSLDYLKNHKLLPVVISSCTCNDTDNNTTKNITSNTTNNTSINTAHKTATETIGSTEDSGANNAYINTGCVKGNKSCNIYSSIDNNVGGRADNSIESAAQQLSDNQICIAMADPLDIEAYDGIVNIIHRYCPRVIAPASEIEKAISRCYYQKMNRLTTDAHNTEAKNKTERLSSVTGIKQQDLLNFSDDAPVIKLVNTILFQAVNLRASDIHIEPYEKEVKIRFRIDGVLHDVYSEPLSVIDAFVSRLKIMANLNIAERRLPQDGQSRIKIGSREMDIRVSIIPTSGGERVVLRLLDNNSTRLTMPQIGFADDVTQQFNNLIHSQHGIILLTGPTGSGKTTTLYCAINELNSHERNILTVEDPIEYQIAGVGQMQVKPKINLTFANCLRHILRQDPDVIMIGEIRDVETAEIAIHASLTGHLVLSTLHTNDSASAITRLIDMGIEPYLVSSSLLAVMAQRLVRVICPKCKVECKTEYNIASLFGDINPLDSIDTVDTITPKFYTGAGCSYCGQTGYYGRTAIAELLSVNDEIKEMIIHKNPAHTIHTLAVRRGMRTLRQDGLRQVTAGVTTVEEILRVTGYEYSVNTMGDKANV